MADENLTLEQEHDALRNQLIADMRSQGKAPAEEQIERDTTLDDSRPSTEPTPEAPAEKTGAKPESKEPAKPEPSKSEVRPAEKEKRPEADDKAEGSKKQFEKPESKHTRLVKEQERYDREEADIARREEALSAKKRDWQTLHARKAKVEEQEAEISRTEQLQPGDGIKDNFGYTTKDYLNASNQLRQEGSYDEAFTCLEHALRLTIQERDESAKRFVAENETQLNESWKRDVDQLCEQRPELNDRDHPLAKAVLALVSPDSDDETASTVARTFRSIPHGFGLAIEVAELQLRARRTSDLEKQNEALKAENAELRGMTQLDGSPSGRRGGAGGSRSSPDLDAMPLEDFHELLRSKIAQGG